jgi:striatin 1/3/4
MQNSNLPLSLPNLPSFDQMPYNGRPRKVMPEVSGKDFAGLNNLMSGPPSAPAASGGQGGPLLERSNTMALAMQQAPAPAPEQGEPTTMIFRPDDAGKWKEQLGLSHEASEKARLAGQAATGAAAWAREDDELKEDGEADDEEGLGEHGEDAKVWKTRRTLRKYVRGVVHVGQHA